MDNSSYDDRNRINNNERYSDLGFKYEHYKLTNVQSRAFPRWEHDRGCVLVAQQTYSSFCGISARRGIQHFPERTFAKSILPNRQVIRAPRSIDVIFCQYQGTLGDGWLSRTSTSRSNHMVRSMPGTICPIEILHKLRDTFISKLKYKESH